MLRFILSASALFEKSSASDVQPAKKANAMKLMSLQFNELCRILYIVTYPTLREKRLFCLLMHDLTFQSLQAFVFWNGL